MKSKILIYMLLTLAVVGIVFIIACIDPGKDETEKCLEMSGCEQFNCLFVGCWCAGSVDDQDPVIYESGIEVKSIDDAKSVVDKYFLENPGEEETFHNTGDLGYNWYNLFYGESGETVYTIGPGGNIYRTECGV